MAVVVGLLAALLAPPLAQAESFGRNIENWSFTRSDEGKNVFNCRAIHKAGGREDIVAMRTNLSSYVSVKGEGRQGAFPDTTVWPLNGAKTGRKWTVKAVADKVRLAFLMPNGETVEALIKAGGYEFLIGNSEETGRVVFGKSAGAAWDRIQECVAK